MADATSKTEMVIERSGEIKMSKKSAVLIGSVPLGTEAEYLHKLLSEKQEWMWIAVDGGIGFFAQKGIIPDWWIGDMDSVDRETMGIQYLQRVPESCIKKVPVEKDDTDMALAVSVAYDAGCEEILIFGGIGGERISHTLANIQLMHAYAVKNCHIQMIAEKSRMEVMGPGKKVFSADMKGELSVLAVTDNVKGVRIQGMKYEYEGDLTNRRALGVSNAFIGRESSIEVADGILLIIFE